MSFDPAPVWQGGGVPARADDTFIGQPKGTAVDKPFKPFMDAAYGGDLSKFKALIADRPEIVAQQSSISHPNLFQFIAVEGGLGKIPRPTDFARVMIEAGAPLDEPFVAAASVGSRALVDLIIEAGVSIEACAPWTALEETLYWAHQDLGHYLAREHNASVPSLRAASELGRLDLMADYFADDSSGLLPSAGPVRFPFGENESDTDQDVMDQALILALKNEQYEAAALLLEKGADINGLPPGNHEHCTPLHQAVYKNDRNMVDWLLERGAVATIEDPRFNATAIGWAEHFGHAALVKRLKAKSAG